MRVEKLSSEVKTAQRRGELEGARPASNEIECPAKPCFVRRAARAARTFTLRSCGKVTAFLRLRKSLTRLFRQPEGRDPLEGVPPLCVLSDPFPSRKRPR